MDCVFKSKFLAEMTANSLESFSANIVNIAVIAIHIKSTNYLSSIMPGEICKHKTFLYFHYLNLTLTSISLFLINRFIKNVQLRKKMWNEVVALFKRNF